MMGISLKFVTQKEQAAEMKVIPLNEGLYSVTKEKVWTPISQKNSDSSANTLSLCPFLVVGNDELIVLDTGLGLLRDGKPTIVSILQKLGYNPDHVTKVLLSHLHKDHTGGIGYFSDDVFIQNFKNATIYLQNKELEYALTQAENPSYDIQILSELSTLPNVYRQEEVTGTVSNAISFEMTGGHSPFHQVFWIKSGDETYFYGADNLPVASYLKYPTAYKSDFDGKKAMFLRKNWALQGKENHWSVLFYHDWDHNIIKF